MTFCTIVLHVAGDVPASPVLGSGVEVDSPSPTTLFYPRLGVVPSSPLISASPSISDGLCDLVRSPPVLSSCAFPPMSSLPSEVFLLPPGGPRPRRGQRTLERRRWYQGRFLRPAYISLPQEGSDQCLLVPVRFPDSLFEPKREVLPETSWGYCPVIESPAKRSWMDLVERPARYDDPRMVPLLECVAAWAMVFVLVPEQWQQTMVLIACGFLALCGICFI